MSRNNERFRPAPAGWLSWLFALLLVALPGTDLRAQTDPAPAEPPAADAEAVPGDPTAPEEIEPVEPPGPDLTEANELVRAQQYEEADAILETLLVEFPDDVGLLLFKGEVLLAFGRPADARPLLERTIELDPELPRAHFQLATILQASGDVDGALDLFQREIELNEADDVQIMARLNRSILFEQAKRWEEAAAEMEAILAIDPDSPQYYGDLAGIYLQSGALDEAASALDRGVEAGFSSPRHYYILGSRYYRGERYEEAAGAFEQALVLNPGFPEAERSLAGTLEKMGRNDEAAAHFRKYLELTPDAKDAKEVRARIDSLETG